ncbi:YhgE/Pip domain-containing protein [Limosilactobacillus fastidiosus]|uniref:ABC transporter permease n=1 Tax=Limosilactobacillus fastidiosus TaxID=2759855 RepID=A0A7W3TY90_9LACO|nr:ABC transporter permease [Limosilactobacillus fastidiosus]MBB1062540.1 ABC transporter permease [Limosilactobacillus fastidiosus]MBB1085508.1 ABC transporter permease [Limosilactobacillus fastidiosus]MCD7083614.1 ABC transporter permease [Limosilactobacillus fastidiosus]MCD7085961.1 ABC transporter permease [Limosilactobacillus fastidiosus]MCD7114395.1 ABC transporter permease [Limosilactobacillus fastidiosus]
MFGKFIKSKGVFYAFLILLTYSFLVFTIYFTGYKPLPSHVTDLPITLVNQDKNSSQLNSQLKQSLSSFKTVHETDNLGEAVSDLKSRKTYLVIDIPENFNKNVKNNENAKLNFYVNEANQSSVVSGMKNVATKIGNAVNNKVQLEKGKAVLTQTMMQQIKSAPAIVQAQQAPVAQTKVNDLYGKIGNSVSTDIHRVNKVETGFNNSMAPFFISLAAYLGAMIGTVILYGTYAKFAKKVGRFKSFAMLEGVFVGLAVIGGAIVATILICMTKNGASNWLSIWLAHALEIMGTYNLNLIFLLLLGQAGTTLNIFLTMFQVIAGAGMIPVQIMGSFFKAIHGLAPMYYSIMANFDLLYANGASNNLIWSALLLIVGYIIVNLIIVTFRKKQPMLNFEDFA